jgi:hypothetical protein
LNPFPSLTAAMRNWTPFFSRYLPVLSKLFLEQIMIWSILFLQHLNLYLNFLSVQLLIDYISYPSL